MRALLTLLFLSTLAGPVWAQSQTAGQGDAGAEIVESVREAHRQRLLDRRNGRMLRLTPPAAAASSGVLEADSLALVDLYRATDGGNWVDQSGWLSSEVRFWAGIGVTGDRVTSINLNENRLRGALPASIGDLTALRLLTIGDFFEEESFLSGSIPASIGNLVELEMLDLASNELEGAIPNEITQLVNLAVLDLSDNRLDGQIPTNIGAMTALLDLSLFGNQLTGAIPVSIGNLSNLASLDLGNPFGGNQLSGTIPDGVGNLSELNFLVLNDNDLEGEIPSSIGNLSQLFYLGLGGNRLTGQVPASLGNLASLFWLDFGLEAIGNDSNGDPVSINWGNDLEGPLPPSLAGLSGLTVFYAGNNRFTGAFPAGLNAAPALQAIQMQCNALEDLPDLSGAPSLLLLDARNNRFGFDDLIPNAGIQALVASPQAPLEIQTVVNGSDLTLSVDVGGSGNVYQWYRDGAPVSGATSASFTVPGGDPSSIDRYFVRVTNPGLPSVTLTSESSYRTLFVLTSGDESDADLTDGACDVDASTPGDQCTLRAAIETLEAAAGGGCGERTRILISGTKVRPTSVLPTITRPVLIEGGSNGGIDGRGAGSSHGLVIDGGQVTVRDLTIDGFGGYGIAISGGAGHVIEENQIGEGDPNGSGAVLVNGGTNGVRVGGLTSDSENVLVGGVTIEDTATRGVAMLRNRIVVEQPNQGPLPMLIDLANDGPSCAPWAESRAPDGPNGMPPAPRVLDLQPTQVTGIARPGAQVVAYRVDEDGFGRWRYWSTSIKAIGVATAGADSAFAVPFDDELAPGARVVLGMVDAAGNASEIAQVRRPVVYLPGVGGSWLVSRNDNLFIPIVPTDYQVRSRIDRLAMQADGSDLDNEDVQATAIVESYAGQSLPYGPVLARLQAAGYAGNETNASPGGLDLWRFWYDWRQDPAAIANDLRARIDRITSLDEDIAASCEVDIVTHSNGGMVSSSYVWDNREHSQDRVNRLMMSAAPYLGAVQVVSAHTNGYLFGLEEQLPLGSDLDWGRLTKVFQNLPDGYGLLPSATYWQVQNPKAEGHQVGYLTDLAGRTLRSHDATRTFFGQPKTDPATDRPLGLARNLTLWDQVHAGMNAIVDDWTTYEGPPHVFRQVGRQRQSTATLFRSPMDLSEDDRGWFSNREEEGDSDLHVAYRESLRRHNGWGDGTVPLLSATLGGGVYPDGGTQKPIGVLDLSGRASPWIEDFEYYPCDHVGMVSAACADENGRRAIDRTVEILASSVTVQAPDQPAGKTSLVDGTQREVIRIDSDAPVLVWLEDGAGNRTGPESMDRFNRILYEVPDVGYASSLLSTTVSVPVEQGYTVTAQAIGQDTRIEVSRVSATGSLPDHVVFDPLLVEDGGAVSIALAAGGTGLDVSVQLDADADGGFESSVAPLGVVTSAQPGPAVPEPEPGYLDLDVRTTDGDPTVGLTWSGGDGTWELIEAPSWISLSASGGSTGAATTIAVQASTLGVGAHTGAVRMRVTIGTVVRDVQLPVRLVRRDGEAALASIRIGPGAPRVAVGDSLKFWASGRDQYGRSVAAAVSWTATGGTVGANGLYRPGDSPGRYQVTATSGNIQATIAVEIIGAVAVDEGLELPEESGLIGAYPNPLASWTRVRFGLAEQADVRLELYDLLGRRVKGVDLGSLGSGTYERTLLLDGLGAGAYVLRMEAGGRYSTRLLHVVW